MKRRTILQMLALALVDPEILIWTPGKKTIIEAPRYSFEQFQQWEQFNTNKMLWLDCLEHCPSWIETMPDIYERIAAGDRRARELGIIK